MSVPTTPPAQLGGKREWRARVRADRRSRAAAATTDPTGYQADRARAATAIADALLAGAGDLLLDFGPNDVVALYESLDTEPPTEQIIADLRARGVPVIVPVLLEDKDLAWTDAEHTRSLPLDAIAHARLVVVPALAIDVDGIRLGQGGGSYDRALTRIRRDALVVALLFDDELSTQPVPHEDHDRPVHAVVQPGHGWTQLPVERPQSGQ